MERKNYRVELDNGSEARFVANPTVTVYLTGTVTIASIFDDEGFTAKANPFVGSSTGLAHFYAADGKYDVKFTGGTPSLGGTGYTLGSVLLDDTLSLSTGGGGITSINALTALSQTFATSITGSNFTISSSGSTHTFNLPFASNTVHGKLSSTDWVVFNSKIGTLNGQTAVSQTLAIGSSGSSPNWASSGSVHTLHLPIASATKTGLLSSSDWIIFNAKQNSLSGGTTSDYLRGGDLTFQPLTTSAVPEGSRLYYTDARVRAAISATSPIAFSAGGVISIQVASGAQPGALSASDWTTFNNKISSVTTDATGTDFSSSTAAGAVTVHLPAASPTNTGGKITNAAQSLSGAKTWYSTHITAASRRRYVRYHTAPASVTVAAGLDDIIVVNKSVAGATAVTLPAGPTAGDTYTIKDGAGNAGAQNITVSPTAGTIDGAGTNVISTNYLAREYVYNGTEWGVV
jgi:hypothetical protein